MPKSDCIYVPNHRVENYPLFIGQLILTHSKIFIEQNENNIKYSQVSVIGIYHVTVGKSTKKRKLTNYWNETKVGCQEQNKVSKADQVNVLII